MSKCTNCGTNFVQAPESLPYVGLCKYCEIADLKSKLTSATAALELCEKTMNGLIPIGQRLNTQDNRCTSQPMFCVQILVRDTGYDSSYADNKCWWNPERMECVYEEPENLDGWEEFGYKDRWQTVMVAFTEEGCKQYWELNGHNHRGSMHNGEWRIYVESFHRCPEMIEIREAIKSLAAIKEVKKAAPPA